MGFGRRRRLEHWRPLAIAIPLGIVAVVSYLLVSSADSKSVKVLVFTPSIIESENGVSASIERISIVSGYSINRPSSLNESGQTPEPDAITDDRHALIEGRFFNSTNGPVLMRNLEEADSTLFQIEVGGVVTITLEEGPQLDIEPVIQTAACNAAPGWFEILPGASADYSMRLRSRVDPTDADLIKISAIDQLKAGRLPLISFPPFLIAGCDSATAGEPARIEIDPTELGPRTEMSYFPFGPPNCVQTEDSAQSGIWLPPGDSLARDLAVARGCVAGP